MVLGVLLQGSRSLGPHRSDLVAIVPRACGRVRRSQATGRVVVVVLLRVVVVRVVGVMVAPAVPGRLVPGRLVPSRLVPGRLVEAAAGVPVAAAAMREATVGVAAGRLSVVARSR